MSSTQKYFQQGLTAENFRDIPTSIPKELKIIAGEVVYKEQLQVSNEGLKDDFEGTLFLTNYRLFLISKGYDKDQKKITLTLSLGNIHKIKKNQLCDKNNVVLFDIKCKDIQRFWFRCEQDSEKVTIFYNKLLELAFPITHEKNLFAYDYVEIFAVNGWDVYNPIAEYLRMNLKASDKWRITFINKTYSFCPTYPGILVVPSKVNDTDLLEVAKYRSKKRIPVLTWIHPTNLATITRSSQPLVGINNTKSDVDEEYLARVRQMRRKGHKLVIFDARPFKNAVANMATGGGYETEDIDKKTFIRFLKIENIHVMRDSFRKLKKLWLDPPNSDYKWNSYLQECGWLKHIEVVLDGAYQVADHIDRNFSVLVHCSDGWDRTSQLTSLAMLLLDPYYRTIKGFEVLIEKEWLSFGHKFQERIGHGDMNHSDSQRSPIFVQFIDCVWQISTQCPTALEFNEHFLLTILDELYSCRFGTFLYNSERERVENNLKERTVSLWSMINSSIDSYKNLNYNSKIDPRNLTLKGVRANSFTIKFWNNYYCKLNQTHEQGRQAYLKIMETIQMKTKVKKKINKVKDDSITLSKKLTDKVVSLKHSAKDKMKLLKLEEKSSTYVPYGGQRVFPQ